MLHKTRGIVLKTTRYSENSVIVQVYTEKLGLQSYMVNGVRGAKAKGKANLYQPLQLLDMVVYHKGIGGIQRVAEVKNSPAFHSIPFDVLKSSLALFLNELIYRSMRQQGTDENLFEFLFHAIQMLDLTESELADFHLLFMVQFSRYLGFYPGGEYNATTPYFDLGQGSFVASQPQHMLALDPPYSQWVYRLLKMNFEQKEPLDINSAQRRVLLEKLLEYYRFHIDGFGELKSHLVLQEVLG